MFSEGKAIVQERLLPKVHLWKGDRGAAEACMDTMPDAL